MNHRHKVIRKYPQPESVTVGEPFLGIRLVEVRRHAAVQDPIATCLSSSEQGKEIKTFHCSWRFMTHEAVGKSTVALVNAQVRDGRAHD